MELRTPRDADGPTASILRPTDRARRALRQAEFALGALAVVVAVPVGIAVAATLPATPLPATTVQAELLAPSPMPEFAIVDVSSPTPARWTTADNARHSGQVWAAAGLARGALVTVPVDVFGEPAGPPAPTDDPGTTGVVAAIATLLSCWALLAIGSTAWQRYFDRLDTRRWTADWARVEPGWTGRDLA